MVAGGKEDEARDLEAKEGIRIEDDDATIATERAERPDEGPRRDGLFTVGARGP